jgi:hypothetical protein
MNPNSNVTQITDKQPAPAAKFSITASLDGFPITIEVEGKASDLRALVDRLKAIGATPPVLPIGSSVPTKAAGGVPTCPIHNAPLKPSQKPGTFFCPKRNEDGSYCRHKA